jgi:hypothetical protein
MHPRRYEATTQQLDAEIDDDERTAAQSYAYATALQQLSTEIATDNTDTDALYVPHTLVSSCSGCECCFKLCVTTSARERERETERERGRTHLHTVSLDFAIDSAPHSLMVSFEARDRTRHRSERGTDLADGVVPSALTQIIV